MKHLIFIYILIAYTAAYDGELSDIFKDDEVEKYKDVQSEPSDIVPNTTTNEFHADRSIPVQSSIPVSSTTSSPTEVTEITVLNSGLQSNNVTTSQANSTEPSSTTPSLATASTTVQPNITTGSSTNSSQNSTTSTETEKVVLSTNIPIFPKTVIQKSIEWMSDAYTLSILVPVAAGVLFASAIIITIFICNCIRRRCCRRRLKRKTLPDSVKSMRQSDRTRLLAESSDEEF